jgi:hypothetical protein
MSVWTVSAADLCRLQGQDVELTELLNQLLGASTAGSLPPAALRLTLATRIPDGGVDAAVDGPLPQDRDVMGLFAVPTCWQYKACPTEHIKPSKGKGGQEAALRGEIRKPHAKELIKKGYGYRLCIADCLTPERRALWERWLLDEARKINPEAQPPRVVGADLLAEWCSRYPGVVRRLRPFLGVVHDFRTWDQIESAQTQTFVDVQARETAVGAIREFADLSRPVRSPVLVISGEAGVGKTRCVLEAVRSLAGIAALVVATDDEAAAVDVVHRLLNERSLRALFVIDGLRGPTRVRLVRLLGSYADRLRVIAIDNERQDEQAPEGELRLGALGRQDVERVLAANFPEVTSEQRWAIADLAAGFLRLAVDMCRHIHLVPQRGDLAALTSNLRDQYLAARLGPEQRTVVEMMSLAARVGYRGDRAEELGALCSACRGAGLTPEAVIATAQAIRRAPGFIAVGPRFFYVTPRVIAQAAYRSAWERWVQHDPDAFFAALPSALADAVLRQLRDAGTENMRRLFIAFHDAWLRVLTPEHLCDQDALHRLLRLAEVEPETILPILAHLIESATREQIVTLDLIQAGGPAWERGCAARRQLVWLAEWMLRFPELYPFAECILFRLAVVETESFGNNATEIWCQSYRPLLSGTPIPFAERLARLEERLNSAATDAELRLCLRALAGPLTADGPASRMGSPPIIAGRMPPPDWLPTTGAEAQSIWRSTAAFVARVARHRDTTVAEGVIDVSIRHGFGLIRNGLLPEFAGIVDSRPMTDTRRVELLHLLDQFLNLYCHPERRNATPALEAELRAWRERLLPTALPGRLRATIGRDYHDIHQFHEDNGEAVLTGLAQGLLDNRAALLDALPWLLSTEARSAHALGFHAGRLDERGELLDHLGEATPGRENAGLLRGYVVGLLDRHPANADRVCRLLDSLAPAHPSLAFELLTTGYPALSPLTRAFDLVDAGSVPARYLREIWRLVGFRPLEQEEFAGLMRRLLTPIRAGDDAAARAAIDILAMHIHNSRSARGDAPPFATEQLSLVRDVLETTLPLNLGQEGWWWGEVLATTGRAEPMPAIRLAVEALGSENSLRLSHSVEQYLTAAAQLHPQTVMEELGAGLRSPTAGWRLRLGDIGPVIAALPPAILREWVEQRGLEGARSLARLLPAPRLVDGVACVPELTEIVLDRYGEDSHVFGEFYAGAASHGVRSGDIAVQYDGDAEVARHFLTHRCRAIRAWARRAEQSARANADWFRRDDELMEAP